MEKEKTIMLTRIAANARMVDWLALEMAHIAYENHNTNRFLDKTHFSVLFISTAGRGVKLKYEIINFRFG